jgi:exodeoxyribonuclease VII small subunit
MSKAVKNGGAALNAAQAADMPFEEALKKLESIVEAMESDELPLEQLLARFEEGSKLAQVCQAKLAEAELKVQKLEKNAAGELTLKPMPLSDVASED